MGRKDGGKEEGNNGRENRKKAYIPASGSENNSKILDQSYPGQLQHE